MPPIATKSLHDLDNSVETLLDHDRQIRSSARLTAIGLAAGRAVIGAGFWVAPRVAARALGLGEIDDRTVAVSRIAGTRDLVLAAWHLRALDDRDELRRASVAVAAADAGDSVAFALLACAGGELVRPGLIGLAAALPATVAGGWLVRALR